MLKSNKINKQLFLHLQNLQMSTGLMYERATSMDFGRVSTPSLKHQMERFANIQI